MNASNTRRKPWRIGTLLLIAALPTSLAAAIYKWVDDQGQTHFGSSIPAEYANQKQEQVNKQGFTIKTIQEEPLTEEELEQQRREKEAEKAEQQRLAAQRRQDQLLLRSYDSLNALVEAKEAKTGSTNNRVKFLQGQIREREELLRRQHAKAAQLERTGKPIDQKLQAAIATTEGQIDVSQKMIGELQQELAEAEADFDAKIARYQELKRIKE